VVAVLGRGVSNAMGGRAFPLPWRPHIGRWGEVCKREHVTNARLWAA
jgi:hypothetical protein